MATVTVKTRSNKDGSKSYRVYYKDPDGFDWKYHKTFERKGDANAEAAQLSCLINEGKLPDVRKRQQKYRPMKFREVCELMIQEWQDKVALKKIRPTTLTNYLNQTKPLIEAFGTKLMLVLTRKDLEKYLMHVAMETSNVSANRRLFVLKQVFRKALEAEACPDDPVKAMQYLPEGEHERNRFLKPEELTRLVEAAKKTRAKHYLPALILLGAELGASKQELLDMDWSRIDLDRGTIHLKRDKNNTERTLPLMNRSLEALRHWRNHLDKERARKGIVARGDAVFCQQDGTPFQSFDSSYRRACKLARIRNYHFHDNRHTFCSNVILAGGTLKDAQELIKHKDPRMTHRYTHIGTERQADVLNMLDEHYHRKPDRKRNVRAVEPKVVPVGEHAGNTRASKTMIASEGLRMKRGPQGDPGGQKAA